MVTTANPVCSEQPCEPIRTGAKVTDKAEQTNFGQKWEIVLSAFGSEFVSYALNLEPSVALPGELVGDREGGVSTPRQAALDALAAVVERVEALLAGEEPQAQGGSVAFRRRQMYVSFLCSASADQECYTDMLHRHCGGLWPDAPVGDDVLGALYRLGKDVFAACLLRRDADDRGFGFPPAVTAAMFRSPATMGVYDAWLADPVLSTLFPQAAEQRKDDQGLYAIQSEFIWSTGSGGSLQLAMIPNHVIGYALAMMRIEKAFHPAGLLAQLGSALSAVRNLASRRTIKAPLVVSLSNVIVSPQNEVRSEHGYLIPADDDLFLNPFPGSEPTAVIVKFVDLKLLDILVRVDSAEDDSMARRFQHRRDTFDAFRRKEEREVDRLRLGLVLASLEPDLISPVVIGQAVFNPLSHGSSGIRPPSPYGTPFPAVTINEPASREIGEWFRRVSEHPESMWMGARRLVRAVTDRQDPLDGFIDAVVCWENMLGSEEGETVFRVCASLAVLLEPDTPSLRRELFAELKDLYATRSKLIHGSREPDEGTSGALRDRAVKIAIKAMKHVYDRPELTESDSSTQRSRILLLGA